MNIITKAYDLLKEKNLVMQAAIAMFILMAAGAFLFISKDSDTIEIESRDEVKGAGVTTGSASKGSTFYVDISGEVKSPGVYELPEDSRIFEVIEKAGGLTSKADTTDVNQAEIIQDGQKIIIPAKGSSGKKREKEASSVSSDLININTADAEELKKITGVGDVTAEKIIRYREENGRFGKIEDIKNVSGIGDKTFDKMKGMITI